MGRPKVFYSPLTAVKLKEYLDYYPDTGIFIWKIRKRAFAGKYVEVGQRAGSLGRHGYWVIGIERKVYQSHRLAWLWMTGEWPSKDIDHKNLKKDDNCWENLRLASEKENCSNRRVRSDSQTGIKGVSMRGGKYRAAIQTRDGVRLHLGCFDTPEEARAAYAKAAELHHGEFARAA